MKTNQPAIYSLVRRVKDSNFDVDRLHHYCLSMQVGIRDFKVCVVDKESNSCLLLEDYVLKGVKTINTRLEILSKLFEDHHFLTAGFWKIVNLSVKSHKFSLIPANIFYPDDIKDYLMVNCTLNENVESEHFYSHKTSNVVNAFAADKRLVNWIVSLYPQKKVNVIHQGSTLIEGVLSQDSNPSEKTLCAMMDGNVLHVFVTEGRKLFYYNQFSVKNENEFLKYIMLVFKEFGLNQRAQKILLWGSISKKSDYITVLQKYVRNIHFGKRPKALKFNYQFDEILDHQYFDLLTTSLCE